MSKKLSFRLLKADEIDVKIGATNGNKRKNKPITKVMLLLYKDARVDMALLDEVVGAENWQSKYEEIKGNLYCSIGIKRSALIDSDTELDKNNDEWVWKQSNGVESQGTGKDDPNNQKGEASDAFKRAGFMWGIGRELYKWKMIWVDFNEEKDKTYGYSVKEIAYTKSGEPSKLKIVDRNGKIVYALGFKSSGSNYTQKEKKSSTSENTTAEGNIEPTDTVENNIEDLKNLIKSENRKIWKSIIETIKEIAFNNNVEADKFNEYLKQEPYNFFVNELKVKTHKGHLTDLELSFEERKPYIDSNTVIVVNEDFYENLEKYLLEQVFLPF